MVGTMTVDLFQTTNLEVDDLTSDLGHIHIQGVHLNLLTDHSPSPSYENGDFFTLSAFSWDRFAKAKQLTRPQLHHQIHQRTDFFASRYREDVSCYGSNQPLNDLPEDSIC